MAFTPLPPSIHTNRPGTWSAAPTKFKLNTLVSTGVMRKQALTWWSESYQIPLVGRFLPCHEDRCKCNGSIIDCPLISCFFFFVRGMIVAYYKKHDITSITAEVKEIRKRIQIIMGNKRRYILWTRRLTKKKVKKKKRDFWILQKSTSYLDWKYQYGS